MRDFRTSEVGEAYEALKRKIEKEWAREVTMVGRPKPWWKASWKELRKAARKSEGTYETDDERFQAFRRHNLRADPADPREAVEPQRRQEVSATACRRVEQALCRTKNNSAPGPDGVSWKLLKMIRKRRWGGQS